MQLPFWQSESMNLQALPVAQQGWLNCPHCRQVPSKHSVVIGLPEHTLPTVQQGSPRSPQFIQVPFWQSESINLQALPAAQHGWLNCPQSRQVPSKHSVVIELPAHAPPAQHGSPVSPHDWHTPPTHVVSICVHGIPMLQHGSVTLPQEAGPAALGTGSSNRPKPSQQSVDNAVRSMTGLLAVSGVETRAAGCVKLLDSRSRKNAGGGIESARR
jgi:hypothetical protein